MAVTRIANTIPFTQAKKAQEKKTQELNQAKLEAEEKRKQKKAEPGAAGEEDEEAKVRYLTISKSLPLPAFLMELIEQGLLIERS